jgi:hypothetical protein
VDDIERNQELRFYPSYWADETEQLTSSWSLVRQASSRRTREQAHT